MIVPRSSSIYAPWKASRITTLGELVSEFSKTYSQFKVPVSLRKKIEIFLMRTVIKVIPSLASLQVVAPPLPFYWSNLLQYLKVNEIVHDNEPLVVRSDNRLPRIHFIQLLGKSSHHNTIINSFGVASELNTALSIATGETIERSFFYSDGHELNSLEELVGSVDDVKNELRQCLSMFNFEKIKHYSTCVKHSNKNSESKILLPSEMIFIGYLWKKDHEMSCFQTTTSGCAGGFTRIEALFGGLCEIVERDSFLVHWLHRISPPRIDNDSIPFSFVRTHLSAFKHYGIECHFLDVSTDVNLPVICCLLIDRKNKNIMAVGASASFNIEDSFRKALVEARATLAHSSSIPGFSLTHDYKPFSDLTLDRNKRLALWRDDIVDREASFLYTGKKIEIQNLYECTEIPKRYENKEALFQLLLNNLYDLDHNVYSYTVNSKILNKINYNIVRVIVPSLIPLYLTEAFCPLQHPRVIKCPIQGKTGHSINPYPHPFP
jgi:thiazole/oxazole-forming peptide maturase SagD family component